MKASQDSSRLMKCSGRSSGNGAGDERRRGVGLVIDRLLVHRLCSPASAPCGPAQHDDRSWQSRVQLARAQAGHAVSPFPEPRVKMLELLLLRHAKSRWDEPGAQDHERDLAPRGELAATRMGRLIREQGLRPDLVLCSDRAPRRRIPGAGRGRARRCAAAPLRRPALSGVARPHARASSSSAARAPHASCWSATTLGCTVWRYRLAVTGERALRAALAAKFPTAGLALIGIRCQQLVGPCSTWAASCGGSGVRAS